MRYREIGSTGIAVSEIGFGAWGIGGVPKDARAYGPTDDQTSLKALSRAIELGVTFFDTSPLYGYGHSEVLIGMATCGRRDKVVISSKVGYVGFSGDQDFSPVYIRESLEGSLRRLKTDYVDMFQLHDPPMDLLDEDGRILETLEELQEEGKIRIIGISVRGVEDSLRAVTRFPFKSIQVNFNMVDQRILQYRLLEKCKEKGVGVIIRTPLCFGFLTGEYCKDYKFDDKDHRSRWSKEQVDLWANAYKLFISELTEGNSQTNAQIALRFCLSFPQVSSVIPGMLNKEHVEDNVISSELGPLTSSVVDKFKKIYGENQFFKQ